MARYLPLCISNPHISSKLKSDNYDMIYDGSGKQLTLTQRKCTQRQKHQKYKQSIPSSIEQILGHRTLEVKAIGTRYPTSHQGTNDEFYEKNGAHFYMWSQIGQTAANLVK